MGRRPGTSKTGGRRPGTATRNDLSTTAGMEAAIRQAGLEPPKKVTPMSVLRRTAGVLNVGNAAVAGFTNGVLQGTNPFKTAMQWAGGSLSGQELKGFADVARAQGVQAEGVPEKIALETAGLAADIIFDPLTYLTLGTTGAFKVGNKFLTKSGLKTYQRVAKQISKTAAAKTGAKAGVGFAARKAERVAKNLIVDVGSKSGLTPVKRAAYAAQGVSESTMDTLVKNTSKLFDRGGIKLFGQSIVSGKAIKASPIGRLGSVVANSKPVSNLVDSVARMFKADAGKSGKVVKILDKGRRQKLSAAKKIAKENTELFKPLNKKERTELFDAIFDKKLDIVRGASSVVDELGAPGGRAFAKEVQKTEKLVFDNPKLQAVADALFEGENAIVPRFAKAAGIDEAEVIKFYIPSKFRKTLRRAALSGDLRSVKATYKKKFGGVDTEDLIRDPLEAYTRGQVEVVSERIQSDVVKSVFKEVGVPIKEMTDDVAKRAGYVRMSRNVLENGNKVKIESWVPKELQKELTDVSDRGIDAIDKLAKYSGFDYVTGLFKGYVTALFPGFHMRNLTSNQFLGGIEAGMSMLNPKLQYTAGKLVSGKNLDDVFITKTGRILTLKQIRDQVAKDSDILESTTGVLGRLEQFLSGQSGEILTKPHLYQRINPLSRQNIALEYGRRLGNFLEEQSKMTVVLSKLSQGMSVADAVKAAEDVLFNYSKLSPFERSVMRRIIPFYTFARKNFELQMKTLASRPGIIANQLKGVRAAGSAIGEPLSEEDIGGLPDFVLESFGIKTGKNKFGQPTFVIGFGLPIEEFLQRFSGDKGFVFNAIQNTLAQINPVIKYPLERATGQDFFRDRPITEITNADDLVSMFEVMPPGAAEQLKRVLQFREIPNQPIYADGKKVGTRTKYVANPFALHFFRNIPTSRFQSTLGFLSDEEEAGFNKALRFFTGVRGFSIDQERQKYYNDQEWRGELEQFMIRMLGYKNYQRLYKPKSVK